MKFSVSSKCLLEALQKAKPFISPRPVIPILGMYHLYEKDNRLIVEGGDKEMSVVVSTDISVPNDIDICVSTKFHDLLSKIAWQTIDISLTENSIAVSTSSGSFRLPVENGGDYSSISIDDAFVYLAINPEKWERIVSASNICTKGNLVNAFMDNVYIEERGDDIFYASTNGQILFFSNTYGDQRNDGVMLPQAAIAKIRPFVGDDGAVISRGVDNKLIIQSGNCTFFVLPNISKPVPYTQFLQQNTGKVAICNRGDFINALDLCVTLTNKEHRYFKLTLNGSIDFTVNNAGLAESATHKVPVEYDGEPMESYFDPRLLMQSVKLLPVSEDLEFYLSGKTTPMFLKGENEWAVQNAVYVG